MLSLIYIGSSSERIAQLIAHSLHKPEISGFVKSCARNLTEFFVILVYIDIPLASDFYICFNSSGLFLSKRNKLIFLHTLHDNICSFLIFHNTLYKLYAVPVRVCSTREDMHYPWVISSVPVSHIVRVCITRESYHQYPWVISSVPVRICSTRESYPQYPWGYAVPVSHIISTRESYPQYPWGYAVPMRICITREGSFIHSSFI